MWLECMNTSFILRLIWTRAKWRQRTVISVYQCVIPFTCYDPIYGLVTCKSTYIEQVIFNKRHWNTRPEMQIKPAVAGQRVSAEGHCKVLVYILLITRHPIDPITRWLIIYPMTSSSTSYGTGVPNACLTRRLAHKSLSSDTFETEINYLKMGKYSIGFSRFGNASCYWSWL